ncbi:PiggyBac transposable element-derived protein 4 [Oopsacas minuta]|uniref:PiggyBac transposable element-derived protein 4 n=1 Tax=Oopsacas minuta TaxID=111878 RepID=A0AAV7JC56_9METZ|nr:PiggyBac transposable element-derived protein 4 [Oopsacas minuta]
MASPFVEPPPAKKKKSNVTFDLTIEDYHYDSDEDIDFDELDEAVDSDDSYDSHISTDGSENCLDTSDSESQSILSEMDVSIPDLSGEEHNLAYTARDQTGWYNDNIINLHDHGTPKEHFATLTDLSKESTTPGEFMKLFFNHEVCNHILEMTNKKLQFHLDEHPDISRPYFSLFVIDELYAFIGMMILFGVFRSSREPLSELYSDDPNKGRPIFPAAMPRDRMKHLLRFLRFDDIYSRIERVKSDKLAPIRFVFDNINSTLNSAYSSNTNVTIDEHLCRYRGKCPFRQYIPSKPDKYGIKVFILADAKTFYPMNLEIYTGKCAGSRTTESLSMRLTSILKPGQVVTGDNYFTSVSLVRKLLIEKGIYYNGTIRKSRKEIPKEVNEIKGLMPFTSRFLFGNGFALIQYVPRKNKSVLMLSSVHFTKETAKDDRQKPLSITDYNKNKCGVDKLDQNIKEFRPYRAIRRWPCVVFF